MREVSRSTRCAVCMTSPLLRIAGSLGRSSVFGVSFLGGASASTLGVSVGVDGGGCREQLRGGVSVDGPWVAALEVTLAGDEVPFRGRLTFYLEDEKAEVL